MTTRQDCLARDRADPLAALRDAFDLPDGVIYLDGNSLGVLPKAAPARLASVIQHEWGTDLIRSWNTAGWIDLPQRVGNKIAKLVGAGENELVVADSTSVNLFKVLSAALRIVQADAPKGAPTRRCIVSERSNFPTDLYIAESLAHDHGMRLVLVEPDEIAQHLNADLAVLMLTQVNYRTGRMHDMAALSAAAHAAGALAVWDLAHSAGAVPVDLQGANADFAVGCGYKYLNGGPGAPAFVFAASRHLAAIADDTYAQPLAGWLGHHAPFEFVANYRPAESIDRYAVGTPSILALSALEAGVDTVRAAGIDALRSALVEAAAGGAVRCQIMARCAAPP